jgi:hypothetical protein
MSTGPTRASIVSLRLYINDRLIAEGMDSDLPAGRYGLVTYRAAADFDTFSSKRP